ncbi:N-acyl homoserine lactonase family protein [Acidisoma cladoniae]|uniref:N-acyl homoserine lactonase family protein n=1 Tax=Acidisoma cladoniae TaxID=3040935 RepID=UPI00254ACCD1|nr:N-acyl homoserine lactonase family protein [Acidisoma sp. PAMC 29798]
MNDYSIWVLEYAYVAQYHVSGIVYGAHNQGYRKLPYCYVVIKGHGTVAMVDVGYNEKDMGAVLARRFNVEAWQSPETILAQCGVTPEEVEHVFLSHAHFDHMGNTDAFPNAKFYLQEKELSKWVWAMALDQRFRWLNIATDPADVMRVVDLARQGRLVCLDGDAKDVLPGIDCTAAYDTHTWGSMFVTVRNDTSGGDNWVLAGDLVYSFENLTGQDPKAPPMYVPVGLGVGSQTNMLFTTDAMVKQAGGDVSRVIPVHEDKLKDAFPSRTNEFGLQVIELALADGELSLVA